MRRRWVWRQVCAAFVKGPMLQVLGRRQGAKQAKGSGDAAEAVQGLRQSDRNKR